MAVDDTLREWWTSTLLGEQVSAHPIFGPSIDVRVEGAIVTLTGEVESADQAEEMEREARTIDMVETVVNHLKIIPDTTPCHLQTVIAVFRDMDTARVAAKAVERWKLHGEKPAELVHAGGEARALLHERAEGAGVPLHRVKQWIDAVDAGKVLLIDHGPEDDALRIISALEGTPAETIGTLPPEPATTVTG